MPRDTKDAAIFLGLAPSTLETWRSRGGGPKYLKMGDRVVYADSDLDAFLDSCRRSSTAPVHTARKSAPVHTAQKQKPRKR